MGRRVGWGGGGGLVTRVGPEICFSQSDTQKGA